MNSGKIFQKWYLIIFCSLIIYPVHADEGNVIYESYFTGTSIIEKSGFIEFHVENDSYILKLPRPELIKAREKLHENGIPQENLFEAMRYILVQTYDAFREESWQGVGDTERFQYHVDFFIEHELQSWTVK